MYTQFPFHSVLLYCEGYGNKAIGKLFLSRSKKLRVHLHTEAQYLFYPLVLHQQYDLKTLNVDK
jgi:hypothetical protein